ncbi:hypothetical protein MSAN_01673700 [Mycena sanguinolenta]|uniref:Uncharacterized protein n=1 Tax=Mycena sanguinolenta TaxID=230812 RepID=A0A8H6Y3H1_9AGAR|nr:hypothetical protein MSAN_01673700 [Mycena sanguinolenta]
MLDNLRLGCVDKDAIEKTHRICGCFDKQVYGQVVEELCAGAINYLRFPNPRLRDIYTAIAQNAEWSALVTRIARRSGNISQDIRTLHHLLVKGPLADLVEEYKRSINARKMDYNQMMNMVILAKP